QLKDRGAWAEEIPGARGPERPEQAQTGQAPLIAGFEDGLQGRNQPADFHKVLHFQASLKSAVAEEHPQPGQCAAGPPGSYPLVKDLLGKAQGESSLKATTDLGDNQVQRILTFLDHVLRRQPPQGRQVPDRTLAGGGRSFADLAQMLNKVCSLRRRTTSPRR